MIPQGRKIIPLALLAGAFLTMPPAGAQQRRVFTNDDFPAAPAPAPPAASTPETSPAGSPSSEAAPAPSETAVEAAGAVPAANIEEGLPLAQHLQEVLQKYRADISLKQEQDLNGVRQDRWRRIVDLATQLIVQNQLHIADLQAQQAGAEGAETEAQAGAQPAP